MRFKDCGIIYALPYRDILYIEKDGLSRGTIIVTEFNEFQVHKPLSFFRELLDDRFVQTHRACIMNKERIMAVDKRSHLATFDNGKKIDLISTRFNIEELIGEL